MPVPARAFAVPAALGVALATALGLGGCLSSWSPAPPVRAEHPGGPPPAPGLGRQPAGADVDPRPVVLDGADLGPLLGIDPDSLVAVAWHGGRARRVPVQVDERFVYDLATVYDGMEPGDCPRASWCRDVRGHAVQLGYADAGTHVGPDPDPTLDALDEVALLAADFGDRAPPGAVPPGVDPSSGVEVRVEVEGRARAATLWRRTGPGLRPPAPRLTYRAVFERGPYLATYDRAGRRPPWAGWPAGYPSGARGGSNPERSWVQTPHYALAFSDRWVWDRLHVGPPGARGPDLLDVDMVMFGPGVCQRTPRTGSLSEGGFLVNTSGPVRAIRHAVGFNSGPLVEAVWTFYPRLVETRTTLRVHRIPGMMTFLDLSDAARGAVYRDSRFPDGVVVDGRPDGLGAGSVAWQAVEHEGRGWVTVHEVEAEDAEGEPAGVPVEAVYQDEARPYPPACMTDRRFLGAHGVWARGPLRNTDPRHGPAGRLALRRQIALGGGRMADLGALQTPLVPRVRALGPLAAPAAGSPNGPGGPD